MPNISWMWGGNRSNEDYKKEFIPPTDGGQNGGGKDGKGASDGGFGGGAMDAYRFDSSALERAAKAAKELENNANAKEILEMTKAQELKAIEELKAQQRVMEQQMQERHVESQRQRIQEQHELDKKKVEYENQFARRRLQEKLEAEQRNKEEMIRRDREEEERKVQRRRAEFEEEMKKRSAVDLEKMKLKVREQIKAEGQVRRENHDLHMQEIREKAKLERETKLEYLKSFSNFFGQGINSFFGDRRKVEIVVGGTVVTVAGIMFARHSLGLMFRRLEANIMKPSIIRETSRITLNDIIKEPIKSAQKIKNKFTKTEDTLQGIVLKPEVEAAIRDVALEVKQCRTVQGSLRNILLYGPPGTGKTFFARKLALNSGMDYALMTGGDLQMLGGKGVDPIHKLFAWANTSRKGLVLFMDEADAFLLPRNQSMDQNKWESMAAFLSHSGSANSRVLLVLTSNVPHMLDRAVLSRLPEKIEFGLPGKDERLRIIVHYFDEKILQSVASGKWRMKLAEEDWSSCFHEVADMTEGFSGRDLLYLTIDWQMKTLVSESGVLTKELLFERVKVAVERKKTEAEWEEVNETKRFDKFEKFFQQSAESALKGPSSVPPVTMS